MKPIHREWLKNTDDMLKSLLADEIAESRMLTGLVHDLRQLQAKNSFRLALLNQLIEERRLK
jgi:hypothetical protein